MALAVVRNLGAPPGLRSAQDFEDFEQELVDQYALAMAGAGLTDGHIARDPRGGVRVRASLAGAGVDGDRSTTPTGSWSTCAGSRPGAQHGADKAGCLARSSTS